MELKKTVNKIPADTRVEILDIKCNDKQRIFDTDLRDSQVEVSLNTFKYKIANDVWVTHDKLKIQVNAYKPRLSTYLLEMIAIASLGITGILLLIFSLYFSMSNKSKLIAGLLCYLALAFFINLYEDKIKTNGTDLKLIKLKHERKN